MTTDRIERAIERYRRKGDAAGQLDIFSGEERKAPKTQGRLRWITLHDKNGEGTTHVQISDDGSIHSGPEALRGRNLNHLGRKAESHEIAPKQPENPYLKSTPQGTKVGHAMMSIDDIKADPHRFQYKVSGIDQETGTNGELKKVKEYNPSLGGQLLVWHDPADGKTYVVNGHHRHELASRSPRSDEIGKFSGHVPVYYVNAKDHVEARAAGALANIAEGRGTATDAARFMRDMGIGLEDFNQYGVSPKVAVAQAALDLKQLSPKLFQKLSNGMLTEHRAQVIGRYLPNEDAQDQLFKWIEKNEKPKKEFTDNKVAEMCRQLAAMKPTRQNAGGGMFDDFFDEFPIEQRADVTEYVRRHLSSEHRTLKDASSNRRKTALEGVGDNRLDTEANREQAGQAELRADEFDHRANAAGHPLAVTLDQYAEQLYREPKRKDAILKQALKHAKELLNSPESGSEESRAGRVQEPVGKGDDSSKRVPTADEITRMSRVDRAVSIFRYSRRI